VARTPILAGDAALNPSSWEFGAPACEEQFARKVGAVTAAFSTHSAPPPSLHPSQPMHYRQRAEFRIRHDGHDLHYAMFDPAKPKEPVRIDQFPAASHRINALMRELRAALLPSITLRERLFQVEFLTTLTHEALVTLIYHRSLDAAWTDAAHALEQQLGARIIGRSRGQRIVLSEPYITERLEVDGRQLLLRQPEGCFTQPNAEVNRAMLGWARNACGTRTDGLLELYCGIGNFTVALADRFSAVLATEINPTALEAARHNLSVNRADNTFVARMASHEVAQALSRQRPFRRLHAFDLDAFHADTVLVDPPRAGLDDASCALLAQFARIVYISCNPQTLLRDVARLGNAYRIERFALFDQFPYTPHIECGVMLQRRHH
jgi:tRNA (uracil-5-)-methyltransferase